MVAIPVSRVMQGQCPIHPCLRYILTPLGPFADPDEVIVTNPLDEQQELAVQREESARRHAQMVTTLRNQRDYVFTPPSVEERLRTWSTNKLYANASKIHLDAFAYNLFVRMHSNTARR